MTDEQAHATANVIDALDAQIAVYQNKVSEAKRKGQDARANYWQMKVDQQQATRKEYAAQLEGEHGRTQAAIR